jgi:hypothetical protein
MGLVSHTKVVGAALQSSAVLSGSGSIGYPIEDPNGTIWAAQLYVPTASSAATYLSDRVFQEAQAMGITHIHIWQYNFDTGSRTISRSQLVDAVRRMKNYGLKPIIDLEYNVNEAVALVTALGTDAMIYEIGKEPHITGTGGSATVDQYVSYFNQIVTAARQVNPNAMYGGPTVGSPTTSPQSRSGVYVDAYLQQCDGDFISVHSYPGGSTKSDAISRARSSTISDVQQLKSKMAQYGKNLPIFITEIQYTSGVQSGTDPSTNWSWDAAFMDSWTTALMSTADEQGMYAIVFWCLIGYDNNFAILRPPAQNYERKPQFSSIQSYLIP